MSPSEDAKFGFSLSINSNNEILSAVPGHNSFTGKVVVYHRNHDLTFSYASDITPPSEHAATGMQFGSSISTDGDLLIISAPNDNSFAGSIFLYLRNTNGDYQFLEKIISQTPAAGETFGYKVLIDDSWLFVSSLQIANSGAGKIAAYRINPDNNSISFHSVINANDGSANDEFGHDFAYSNDYLVVGAPKADSIVNGSDSGATYLFEWNAETDQWDQLVKLASESSSVNDQFGYSTEVLDEFIAIGSLKADGNGVDSGAVHIFKQNEQAWEEIDTLVPSLSGNDQLFGTDLIKEESIYS